MPEKKTAKPKSERLEKRNSPIIVGPSPTDDQKGKGPKT